MLRDFLAKNKLLKFLYRICTGHQIVFLNYRIHFKPRWTQGNEPIKEIIESAESSYVNNIKEINGMEELILKIVNKPEKYLYIDWENNFIPALDALSIMWAAKNAKNIFMEVGSGNSTIFAREAIKFYNQKTKIISIDPRPRKDIDSFCDEITRIPLENIDVSIFDQLKSGDVLFVDNSHRSFMNSDVTVFMLEVLPRLNSGVLIGLHDIFLPYDYFEHWSDRAYNEQYLLGCYLVSNPNYFDIQLANYWISRRGLHKEPLKNVWASLGETIRDRPSSAFWGTKK